MYVLHMVSLHRQEFHDTVSITCVWLHTRCFVNGYERRESTLALGFRSFQPRSFLSFLFCIFFFFLFCRMRPSTVQSIPTVHIYTRSLVTSYVVVSHLPSHRRRRAFLVTTLTICTSQIYLFIYFFLHNVYVLLFCILYFVFVDLYLLKHTTLIKYKNNSH